MDIVKILAVCFIATVLVVVLRQYKQEYGLVITLAALIIVLYFIFSGIFPAVRQVQSMLEKSGIEYGYFKTAFKALGVAYITGFIADTCRDYGQNALASNAELAGKCAIFLLSLPMLFTVLETALGFAGA